MVSMPCCLSTSWDLLPPANPPPTPRPHQQLCNDWAIGGKGGLAKVKGQIWGLNTVVLSFLDWPLRK